jgi:hypothetical protein
LGETAIFNWKNSKILISSDQEVIID